MATKKVITTNRDEIHGLLDLVLKWGSGSITVKQSGSSLQPANMSSLLSTEKERTVPSYDVFVTIGEVNVDPGNLRAYRDTDPLGLEK